MFVYFIHTGFSILISFTIQKYFSDKPSYTKHEHKYVGDLILEVNILVLKGLEGRPDTELAPTTEKSDCLCLYFNRTVRLCYKTQYRVYLSLNDDFRVRKRTEDKATRSRLPGASKLFEII